MLVGSQFVALCHVTLVERWVSFGVLKLDFTGRNNV